MPKATRDRRGSIVLFAMMAMLVASVIVVSPQAMANHPPGSCVDAEPETATNTVGTTHTITATLRFFQNGNCTGSTTTPTGGNVTVNFNITAGPHVTSSQDEFSCNISNNSSSCIGQYTGDNVGTDTIVAYIDEDNDDVLDASEPSDQVSKTWTGTTNTLDCDDPNGPDTERETNVGGQGAASSETYICTLRDTGGQVVATPTTINAEVENTVNDPDVSDGASYASPDYSCVTSNGVCSITVAQSENELGTAEICFFVGNGSTCGNEATNENQAQAGSDVGNDLADQVEKTWVAATTAARLDCTPETDTNPTGTGHTVTCVATTSAGATVSGAQIDIEASGTNDPDGGDSASSPDFTCTTGNQGTCTFTHGTGGVGTTNTSGTTTYRAWIDADLSNASTEADLNEVQNEATGAGATAEPDNTDVVAKTWSGVPNRLTISPTSDSASIGTCNPYTITVFDVSNQPVAGISLDVEQIHALATNGVANDEPTVSFCTLLSGTNPSAVDENRGDLRENPDNRGTAGGETSQVTNSSGQITIGVSVASQGSADGSGNVTITAFYEVSDNDDADTADPRVTATKTWVPGEGRSIDCSPNTATNPTGTTHTITCVVRDRSGELLPGEGVTFTESGPGNLGTATQQTTSPAGQVTATVTSSEGGTQTITGTITDDLVGAEPTEVDECDRGANDPSGALVGNCAESVTKTWQPPPPPPAYPGFETDTRNQVVGTAADDVLTGTAGPDIICGLDGNDTITGGDGDDLILGGDGSDTIRAGTGGDRVLGGAGSDVIRGGEGLDSLGGGSGADVVAGGAADDTLRGGRGHDVLYGNAGSDRLSGHSGNDTLDGGTGFDRCRGGSGRDFERRCES